jgi:hypothetical protein
MLIINMVGDSIKNMCYLDVTWRNCRRSFHPKFFETGKCSGMVILGMKIVKIY